MPRGRPITIIDVRKAVDHYALWGSWSAAATHAGLSYSGLMKALKETFTEERDAAMDRFRDRIRVERVERAFTRDDKSSSWFLQHLATEHLPESREVLMRRVEVTGANGGPLEVTNPDVVAALDRFTGTIARLAAGSEPGADVRGLEPGRAELAAGEPRG